MTVAVKYSFKIRIEEIFSLKEKRTLVNRIKTHLKKNYDCCLVESGFQDSLRYIEMTASYISFSENEVYKIKDNMSVSIELISGGMIESEEFDYI